MLRISQRMQKLILAGVLISCGTAFAHTGEELGGLSDTEAVYTTMCFGADCPGVETARTEEEINETNTFDYIQARIVQDRSLGNDLVVENMETGEMITLDADSQVDFMDRQGSLVTTRSEAAYVLIPNVYFPMEAIRLGQLAGKPMASLQAGQTRWNECQGSPNAAYTWYDKAKKTWRRSCSSNRILHKGLLDMLRRLPKMLNSTRVEVIHAGIMGDTSHQARKSLHNTGRAIDIREMTVSGKKYNYETATQQPGSSSRSFYNKLLAKWEAEVRKKCGSVVAATTINWTDSRHRHHGHFGTTYNCN